MSSPPLPPEIARQMPPDPKPRIVDELASFLADWPLYRPFRYKGNLWSQTYQGRYSLSFPKVLRLYCPQDECKTTQVWELSSDPYLGVGNSSVLDRFSSATFHCRNCRRSSLVYFLHFEVNELRGEITKVGQWPPLSREADPVVVARWDKADILLYRDAMTFRNANKGIAALPYLRRIIETHINDVLDLIADANQRKPIEGFDTAKLDMARKSHRFTDKLAVARDYLPPDLTPAGCPNPIGTLHELLSEGLHERTEEECVEIFDRCKDAFEYVIKKLTEAKREDEAYRESIRKLNKSKDSAR
jgi:hypothetical protein